MGLKGLTIYCVAGLVGLTMAGVTLSLTVGTYDVDGAGWLCDFAFGRYFYDCFLLAFAYLVA